MLTAQWPLLTEVCSGTNPSDHNHVPLDGFSVSLHVAELWAQTLPDTVSEAPGLQLCSTPLVHLPNPLLINQQSFNTCHNIQSFSSIHVIKVQALIFAVPWYLPLKYYEFLFFSKVTILHTPTTYMIKNCLTEVEFYYIIVFLSLSEVHLHFVQIEINNLP